MPFGFPAAILVGVKLVAAPEDLSQERPWEGRLQPLRRPIASMPFAIRTAPPANGRSRVKPRPLAQYPDRQFPSLFPETYRTTAKAALDWAAVHRTRIPGH